MLADVIVGRQLSENAAQLQAAQIEAQASVLPRDVKRLSSPSVRGWGLATKPYGHA